ncbi:type IX secretion system membrane protein PorP/SprF [Capnocytophaga sp. ARDL2]|uniref:PorP/SprF family type IX secretion system membrane protein n=1 Tax=Capnocytophaga sp. ARDL2 TaxID=3238809 RepID=UPI003558334B
MSFNKRKIITLMGITAIASSANAQQDPHYTQYMYNQSVINPAYAGSKESLALGVLHRQQWVGLEGAPVTSTFFGHGSLGKNVGAGISVISDKIGPTSENNVYADVSYTIKLAPGHKLALGVKGGMTLQDTRYFSEVSTHVPDANDPVFAENSSNSFFNVGAGAFYYTDKYYVGLSVPNLLPNNYVNKNNIKYGSDAMHGFFTAGYVFELNPDWKLKPHTMVKYAMYSPVSFDVNLNTSYKDKLDFGLMYRFQDSFGAMISYAVMSNMRIGYAYDYVTSPLNYKTSGSHEAFLLFDINFKRKVSSSPRYF